MASIERTAYPRFKRNPLAKELDALYTPTNDELSFARALARKAQSRFGLLLLLKSFQIRPLQRGAGRQRVGQAPAR